MTSERRLAEHRARLGEMVDRAYSDVACWLDIAWGIHDAIPGGKAVFQIYNVLKSEMPLTVGGGWQPHESAIYERHFWKLDPYKPAMAHIRSDGFLRSDELVPTAELKRSEFYADFLRPVGEADANTALVLGSHGEQQAIFGILYDGRKAERRHAEVKSLMTPLVPRLRNALEVNRLMRRQPRATGPSFIDGLLDAAFVMDSERRLLSVNAAGEALLAAKAGWQLGRDDRLGLQPVEFDQRLGDVVRAACGSPAALPRRGDLAVDLGPDCRWSLVCLPITPAAAGIYPARFLSFDALRQAALLVVRPRDPDARRLSNELMRRFALTPGEMRLVTELHRGGTLAEIADRLGISRSTAQTHLRSVFRKTGTARQRDLVLLTQGYSVDR